MKKSFALLLAIIIFFSGIIIPGKTFVYISLRSSNAVKIFELANRKLFLSDSMAVSGGPAAMAAHPSKKYLYIAQREAKKISTFLVDRKTGKLTCIHTIDAIENPVYLSCDKTGKYLFTAYYAAGKIALYRIEKDGKINSLPLQVEDGFKTPHCILIDNSNKFVFVADKDGDKIAQYIFDSNSGKLIQNNPFELNTQKGTCPRHLVFNGNGKFVYFVNEVGNTVTLFKLGKSGLLKSSQTISTLPDSVNTSSKTADIHLTPDNKFLFASNRGHNSIVSYSVNKITGELKFIETIPTEKNPRSFAIDSSGDNLIVAGESSDHATYYKINKKSGRLTPNETIYLGKQPSWVETVTIKK